MKEHMSYTFQNTCYATKLLELHELTERDITAWKQLESFALEANAYLSPNFIIPAIRYLERAGSVFILMIHKDSPGSSDLVGVFVFKLSRFSKLFPFPHISAYHSHHSYLTGALADQDHARNVMEIIFNYFSKSSHKWLGFVFEEHLSQGLLAKLEEEITTDLGMRWIPFEHWNRSLLYPAELGDNLPEFISKTARKKFNRRMRGLSEIGNWKWDLILNGEVKESNIDDFIRLENMGWKGARKTSLHSHANHAAFFREMTKNFNRDGRAFFAELRLDDQVIASSSNVISGNAGFAFKIGWDPAYAKYSPGIQNELLLLTAKDNTFRQLGYIDSGSAEGSYIDTIWPGKRSIQTGVYLNPNTEKLVSPLIRRGWYPGVHIAKKLKQKYLEQ